MLLIKTNKDLEIRVEMCAVSGLGNFIIVSKDPMLDYVTTANIFSDPEHTEKVVYINRSEQDGYEELIDTFEGYTVLTEIGQYHMSLTTRQIKLRRPGT